MPAMPALAVHRCDKRAAAGRPSAGATLAITLAAFAVTLGGCDGLQAGDRCVASQQCGALLCYANRCRTPTADDDGDGLANELEHEFGSHPDRVDSDDDGDADGVEFGSGPLPRDSDGDGKPDLIESRLRDGDLDCLPDQVDADDATANIDPQLLARDACSEDGVCKGSAAQIRATCLVGQGILQCDYGDVIGWHAGERCDGLDDDCDGLTDEGYAWQGAPIGVSCDGIGSCSDGVVECAGGAAVCSTNPEGSARGDSVEACNGLDDDCDGVTDDGFLLDGASIGGPCLGKGECGVGVVVCGNSGAAICSSESDGPENAAIAELCNGLDDDCDGVTDDGLALDGTPLGGPCQGFGICGKGVVACRANGGVVCSTNPGGPASGALKEICNGLDDNCDGNTDETQAWNGVALGGPCKGVGSCGAGTVVCGNAGKATCSTMPDAQLTPPAVELCNGLDDNCDGSTDEGFAWQGAALGQACAGLGACGAGLVECSANGGVTCSSLADGSTKQTSVELCNNTDDDCDGLTDEDATLIDAPTCAPLGICANATGEAVCTAGVWACAFSSVPGWQGPSETTCDGKDNDCDGEVDEGLAKEWAATSHIVDGGWPSARVGAASATDGALAYIVGGRVGDGTATVLSDELWGFDAAKQQWTLILRDAALAREGATLAWLPAGWVAKGPRLLLMGGVSASGALIDQALVIDPESAKVSAVDAGKAPEPRRDAAALLDEANGALWLLGGASSPSTAAVQRFSASAGAWLGANALPQVASAGGPASACQDAAGAVWWLGSDDAGVRALRQLNDTGDAWITRSALIDGDQASRGGRLLCDVSPGEHWLLGAAVQSLTGEDDGPLGLRRYAVATDTWSQPSVDVSPAVMRPVIERVGAVIVVAFGRTSDGTWSKATALGGQGWQLVPEAPSVIIGGRIGVGAGGDVLLFGGADVLGPQLKPAPVWRRSAGVWSVSAGSVGAARLHPLVFFDPLAKRTLVWAGLGLPWQGTPTQLDGGDLAPAAGGFAVDGQGGLSALGTATLAWLPALRSAARVVEDAPGSAKAWALGRAASGDDLQLWLIDAAAAKATLLQSDPPATVAWGVGQALVRMGGAAEVRLVSAQTSGLVIRRWTAGAGAAWTVEVTDASVPQGNVVALGRPGGDDALLIVFPTGGSTPVTRRLRLVQGALVVQPGAPWSAALQGIGSATWASADSQALLTGVRLGNQVRATLRGWGWACVAP